MGNWHIAIDGHGVHDNGLGHDVDRRLQEFVAQLEADGHAVHHTSLTIGGARTLVPPTDDEPAHYKYLP